MLALDQAAGTARAVGEDGIGQELLAGHEDWYREAAGTGIALNSGRPGKLQKKRHALARRMRDRETGYLRFARDLRVPFPSNEAARRPGRLGFVAVSYHYEVVFGHFLRENTPETVLDTLRWHVGLLKDRPGFLDRDEYHEQPLMPDPDSPLAGGDLAGLRFQDRGWGLLSRSYWLDDDIGWVLDPIEFIAPYAATRGYGGFFREVDEVVPTVFAFADGGFRLTQQRGKIPLWKS